MALQAELNPPVHAPTPTPKPINLAQRGKHFPKVRDIDEIVEKYDFEGNHCDVPVVPRIVPVALAQPTTYEEAEKIVKIYQAVYQGHFPYPEMLDPAYVFSTFSEPTFYWGIFKTQRRGKIIGCYTITIDRSTRTGYLRGLNVHPRYQARVGIREMASAVMRCFLEDHIDEIDKWYIEARTAHTIVQYLGRTGDLLPYALMLNKDIFYEQRETDALLISYKRNIYAHGRVCPDTLPAGLIPFYDHANAMMRCGKPVKIAPLPPCYFTLQPRRMQDIQVGQTVDGYGYTHFTLFDPVSESVISGLYTPAVKTIEKVKYNFPDPAMACTMLAKFHEAARQLNAEYIEWAIPVADSAMVAYFLSNAFYVVQGYLPAWVPSTSHPGKYEDAVMFGSSVHVVDPNGINMIEETQALYDIIMQAPAYCGLESATKPMPDSI